MDFSLVGIGFYLVVQHNQVHCRSLEKGVLADERIAFVLDEAEERYPEDLRLVTYIDEEHDQMYEFLTDSFYFAGSVIASIYKSRWQIELFFKWIKQPQKTPY